MIFLSVFRKKIFSLIYSLFIINFFEHTFYFFTLMIELKNSSNTSKIFLLIEKNMIKHQSKATFAKNKKKTVENFFQENDNMKKH